MIRDTANPAITAAEAVAGLHPGTDGLAVAEPATTAPPAAVDGLTAEVVLVTRNSESDLMRSLDAIRQAAAAADAALLFVDLGSSDGTRSLAARHAPGARAVWLDASDGLIEAVTAAAACSSADVLVVLSPTFEPSSSHAIAELVGHLERHPYAAIAAPELRAHTGAVLRSARPEPAGGEYAPVEWVLGGAIAIRRADLIAVAGSTERRSGPLTEFGLCLELRRRGREVHYVRSSRWLDAGGRAASRLTAAPRRLPSGAWRRLLRHPRYALRLAGAHKVTGHVSRTMRRVFDTAFATLLLVLASPLMIAIAVAIRLGSRGPALFRQQRLGRDAVSFQMFKFRTMHHGADHAPHEQYVRAMIVNRLRADAGGSAQIFKLHPDPRVTRVGRLLRRTSLDELPQLFNVLRGEMTLVGFRPPIPYELNDYPAWYFRRFDGKPGITGLWQVSGRNLRSYEEMVRLDIEYLNRQSWLLDLMLMVRTVGAVVGGRGAV